MMTTITWGALAYLRYMPILIVLCCIMYYRVIRTKRACALLAGKWVSLLLSNVSNIRMHSKVLLQMFAAIFLFIALLRPQGETIEKMVHEQGRDIVFALDISRSMIAADIAPNRLAVAKEKIVQALSMLDGERVGLILFSSTAFIHCPLTNDIQLFKMLLQTIDSETVSRGSTALDVVLTTAIDLFKRMPERKTKLVILLTDGEDFSTNLVSVREQVRDLGIHLYILGVGSPAGAPIPILNMHGNQVGFEKDAQGTVIMSRLHEQLLQDLARDVGGSYKTVTTNDADVQGIVKKVKQFEKESLGEKKIEHRNELYWYPLIISFIALIGEWLL